MRNNNTRLLKQIARQRIRFHRRLSPGRALAGYLNRLDQENALPKTILYNLNPADN